MGEAVGLFLADAETNDLTAFTGVNNSGSCTQSAAAAAKNNGTYGYRLTWDGTAYTCNMYKTLSSTKELYFRGYFKFASDFAMTSTGIFINIQDGVNNRAWLRVVIGSGQVSFNRLYYETDTGTLYSTLTGGFALGEWHRVEIHCKLSSGAGANDGDVQIWLDGTSIGHVTGIDSDTLSLSRVNVGQSGSGVPAAGNVLDMDDIKADSAYIGAYADASVADWRKGGLWRKTYAEL